MNKIQSNETISLTTGADVSAKDVVVDDEKRSLINYLQSVREVSQPVQQESCEETEAGKIATVMPERSDAEVEVECDDWVEELRVAKETCKMQDESLEMFEEKLLDLIMENGKLHQTITLLEEELFTAESNNAKLVRQRNSLCNKLEQREFNQVRQIDALAASERELTYLNARLYLERNSN